MELSKVGAIEELILLAGPYDPSTAKKTNPLSIRARFGIDIKQNAIYASLSQTNVSREISHFFPQYNLILFSAPLKEINGESYLNLTVIPALSQAIVELCRKRPADPHGFIATWLEVNKPIISLGKYNQIIK